MKRRKGRYGGDQNGRGKGGEEMKGRRTEGEEEEKNEEGIK